MNTFNKKRIAVLLPLMLISSTIGVFYLSTILLNKYLGYIIGFMFYWLFWCFYIPKRITNLKIKVFFTDEKSIFKIKYIWVIILLLSTIIAPVFMYTIPNLNKTPLLIIVIGIPLAIMHSFFEELFWRGFYAKQFKTSMIYSIVIPTVFFMLWHISPQFAMKSNTPIIFVISTLPLGLTYAITAYITKSAKWSFVAHAISGILAFSGFLSICLVEGLQLS